MFLKSNCLSDVDIKLSQVNVLMSEINQIISQRPVPVKSKILLPRIDQILSEMAFVVSNVQTDCSSSEEENDNCLKSEVSLDWDN